MCRLVGDWVGITLIWDKRPRPSVLLGEICIMFSNPFSPLSLLGDSEKCPDTSSRQPQISSNMSKDKRTLPQQNIRKQTQEIRYRSNSDPIEHKKEQTDNNEVNNGPISTLTSPRTPIVYPDRIPQPFHSKKEEERYYEIIRSLPVSPKYSVYRTSYPLRSTHGLKIIESYAIVLISFARGEKEPTFLLGHRRESIEMSNIVRGLYDISELYTLLSLISPEERLRLQYCSFEALWQDYWPLNSHMYHVSKAKQVAKLAYDRLKPYLLELLSIVPSTNNDTEWLFPRGRGSKKYPVNKGEIIAIHEFEEETDLSLKEAKKVPIEPYRELYFGSNGSTYATTHYVYMTEYERLPPKKQARWAMRPWMVSNDFEIVAWLTLAQLREKLNPYRVDMVESFAKQTMEYRQSLEPRTLSRTNSDNITPSTPLTPYSPDSRSRSGSQNTTQTMPLLPPTI